MAFPHRFKRTDFFFFLTSLVKMSLSLTGLSPLLFVVVAQLAEKSLSWTFVFTPQAWLVSIQPDPLLFLSLSAHLQEAFEELD